MSNRLRRSRLFVATLGLCLIGGPGAVSAGGGNESAADSSFAMELGPSLDRARDLIKDADYDGAIEALTAAIANAQGHPTRLRDAYLLLIKTFVYLYNDYRLRPQGRTTADLHYEKAREKIGECLSIKELRRTRPEGEEFPEEMKDLFAKVRGEMFGSFRVVELEPPDAVVILAGDTLGAFPGDTLLGDVDLPVGIYSVVVRAPKYRTVTDEIVISPNSTLERPYRLSRGRRRLWYGTAAAGVAGLVAGFLTGKSSGTPPLEPLPEAPPPPSR